MKTDDLVNLLAADTLPVQRKASPRRLALALAAGLPLAVAIMLLEGGCGATSRRPCCCRCSG